MEGEECKMSHSPPLLNSRRFRRRGGEHLEAVLHIRHKKVGKFWSIKKKLQLKEEKNNTRNIEQYFPIPHVCQLVCYWVFCFCCKEPGEHFLQIYYTHVNDVDKLKISTGEARVKGNIYKKNHEGCHHRLLMLNASVYPLICPLLPGQSTEARGSA